MTFSLVGKSRMSTSNHGPLRMLVKQKVCYSLSSSGSPPNLQITREELPKLPRANFPGKTLLISDPSIEAKYKLEIQSLVSDSNVLGIDTETKPLFHSKDSAHKTSPVCLVQLANNEVCVIWRLRRQGVRSMYVGAAFPPILHSILTAKDILKVGHSSKVDALSLLLQYHVNTCNVFDTYDLVSGMNFKLKSLKGLAGSLLGVHLTKAQSKSNWEKAKLTESQIAYASTDAWMSLQIYKSLMSYAEREGYEVRPPILDTLESISNHTKQQRIRQLITNVHAKPQVCKTTTTERNNVSPLKSSSLEETTSLGSVETQRTWVTLLKQSLTQLLHPETDSSSNQMHDSNKPLIMSPSQSNAVRTPENILLPKEDLLPAKTIQFTEQSLDSKMNGKTSKFSNKCLPKS